jgi:type I restriction enzyme S subunit
MVIKLLEEQRQAIIHCAVTRSLDTQTRYKPSEIEWLSQAPESWDVRSFTRCAIERADYRGATPTKTETGVFLVTAKNIRRGLIDYEASKEYVAQAEYATIMRRGLPRNGDLLLTTEAPLGNAALVDREDIALAQRVIRFRLNPDLLIPEFTLYSVLAPYFQNQMLRRGTGSTALGIKASKLPQLQILCPPLAEQRRILELIKAECSPLDDMAERAEAEIDLLLEYRTRLTVDVVTGKLDVREAAANLPDELHEPDEVLTEETIEGAEEDELGSGEIVAEEVVG